MQSASFYSLVTAFTAEVAEDAVLPRLAGWLPVSARHMLSPVQRLGLPPGASRAEVR